QAAEDLSAETMVVIFKRWDDLSRWVDDAGDIPRLRSFACGVVRNLARDLYRTRQRYFLVGESESLNPPVEEPSDSRIEMLDVERTLAQLPDKQSQVLRMELEGFTTAEIAREMCVQESTTRTHLASARRHMRERLYEVFTDCSA
ncbi:MAG TPA: RNA polymerase sigma factor, partial [Pyrinomonadaceae bacterium]|nr:RNA polymerase sigma factor [Pyrinomonadaceae bacterium]